MAAVLGGLLSVDLAGPAVAAPANQWGLNAINIDRAWRVTEGSPDVTIAVIDSGIDSTLPDFRGRIVPGRNFVNDTDVTQDTLGHGTRVAGVAMGRGDGGFRGVAPRVGVMPLVVSGTDLANAPRQIAAAIDFAVAHKADLINISAGSSGSEWAALLRPAVSRAAAAGMPIVVAAGNAGADLDRSPDYPAAFAAEFTNVISVASIDEVGRALSSHSNFGRRSVTLAAPGEEVRAPDLGGGYSTVTGTSYAAPFVAGTVALMRSANRMLTPQQLRDILTQTVTPHPSLNGRTVSGGYLNAARAVSNAADLEFDGEMVGLRSVSDRTQIVGATGRTAGARVSIGTADESGSQSIIPEHVGGQRDVYRLKVADSLRYLGWSSSGRTVVLMDDPPETNQRALWRFTQMPNGSYTVQNLAGDAFLFKWDTDDLRVMERAWVDISLDRGTWWVEPIRGRLTSGGTYWIAAKLQPGSDIVANGNNTGGGSTVMLWERNDGANQRWAACYDPRRGAYRFQNRASSSVALNLAWVSTSNQRQLRIWDGHDRFDDQWWVLQLRDDGNWVIASFHDMGMVVDLDNSQTGNNTRILAWEASGKDNQRWIFDRTTDYIITC